jgi:transposase InsO family protein
LHIPPAVPIPGSIFRRVHIDSMMMPKVGGFDHLVHAWCMLIGYPEWQMLCKENTKSLGTFIFKDLLCRWGPITKIVTDNGPAFWVAVDDLAEHYGIHPIWISPYNSQANGIIKQHHYDVWEAIIKSCNGDKSWWYKVVHAVLWAEHVTVHQVTGFMSYLWFMESSQSSHLILQKEHS